MRKLMMAGAALVALAPAALWAQDAAAPADPNVVEKPAALIADQVPPIPKTLAETIRPYLESRSAGFMGWDPKDGSVLISTRFGNTAQIHRVAMPGGDRTQLTFETDRISGGSWAPKSGDVMIVGKDIGGSENFQIFRMDGGKLVLLTDGKSRNEINAWSQDGKWLAYTSTRRTGNDSDIYIMDPRDPKSDRLVAQVQGGGWGVGSFTPDGKTALVANYISVTKSNLYLLDVASGKMSPLGDHKKAIAYGGGEFAPDGSLWVVSDEGSDFQRIGTMDVKTGKFTPRGPAQSGDVESMDIAPDGSFLAFTVNDKGRSTVHVMDAKSYAVRTVTDLPVGIGGGIDIAEDGRIGLSYTSAKSPADVYSIDLRSLKVTRWTYSETGGLDASINVEPEFVEVKSFDGEPVSGFLYRPDPKKFPGKRPLIVDIHGGPEGQSRPGFMGSANYYLNELGVALFYPNVRGSTGFGKRFVALDNGPFKREDSVKDIAAYLDTLSADPAIDPGRIAVQGGSYGGYMCYASAIRYGAKLKGALCVVAISNFVTFLENTAGYRRDLRRVEYGDERDPKQKAKLIEISPMTRINELKIPLFVVTGANDPRVPKSEADQMVAAVRANGGKAMHLIGMDEGHGFAKKANRDYQFLATLMYWQDLLGVKPAE